jgi:hypothetical protein
VGMQISVNPMENGMKAPQKTKNRTSIWFSNITPRDIPKGMWVR